MENIKDFLYIAEELENEEKDFLYFLWCILNGEKDSIQFELAGYFWNRKKIIGKNKKGIKFKNKKDLELLKSSNFHNTLKPLINKGLVEINIVYDKHGCKKGLCI